VKIELYMSTVHLTACEHFWCRFLSCIPT